MGRWAACLCPATRPSVPIGTPGSCQRWQPLQQQPAQDPEGQQADVRIKALGWAHPSGPAKPPFSPCGCGQTDNGAMKLVILDRDGTLNAQTDAYIRRPEDWQALPGALEAVASLNQAGYTVVLAVNVPGLGRGLMDMASLNAIHARMHKELTAVGARIDAVFFCPHVPEDQCDCRKPKPGLFTQIAERYGVNAAQIDALGNSLQDVQAAQAAGCRVHLVLTGGGRPACIDPLPSEYGVGVSVHADLTVFAKALVARAASPNLAPPHKTTPSGMAGPGA